jgi:hypothetical protein
MSPYDQKPNSDGSFNAPSYTPSDWEKAVAICEAFGATVYLPPMEGDLVNGVVNDGQWEPMISLPISEYEELREKAAMYDELCK